MIFKRVNGLRFEHLCPPFKKILNDQNVVIGVTIIGLTTPAGDTMLS